MLKPFFHFILAVLTLGTAFGQTHSSVNELEWTEGYQLGWHDFQGQVASGAAGDAATAVTIKAKPHQFKRKIYYEVRALFLKQKSWYKDQSPTLLAHEQLHFDIAELYARKARKKIKELSRKGVKDIKVYNREVQKILNQSNYVDQLYDMETLHGSITKKQIEWKNKIKAELIEYNSFKAEKIAI